MEDIAEERLAELQIQALMFDMDIDIEALMLVPKNRAIVFDWLARWKDKRANSDFDELMDIDWE